MPHALTDNQREYLSFIRAYIQANESSPRLDEIAEHFDVAAPTVHKTLEALQAKGFLYFGRDSTSGFFIRLIERAGSAELVTEIVIAGKVDEWGELIDFPGKHGHFASVLIGASPEHLFALAAISDIPAASILSGDLLIFDLDKSPQPGDICIAPIGQRLFLVRIHSKTFDKDMLEPEVAQQYPIPSALSDPELGQRLNWYPLAYTDEQNTYLTQIAEAENLPIGPLSPTLIVATALRLTRQLAF